MRDYGIQDFPSEVEFLVRAANLSYMDAVLHWCETRGVEFEVGGEMVKRHASIRNKIRDEARKLNCVR